MSFRDDLAKVVASDAQHSIEAYAFVLEALQLARTRKLRALARDRKSAENRRAMPEQGGADLKADFDAAIPRSTRRPQAIGHVTGQEVCEAARRLALRQFGFLATLVLDSWGIRSTSDLGDIVYSLIASGHLEKTPRDRRSDFDKVYDFETAFRPSLTAIARGARGNEADLRPEI